MPDRTGPEKGADSKSLPIFCWRFTAMHTIAYFIAGLATSVTFAYEQRFLSDELSALMRPPDSPVAALGAVFQIINGALLSLFLIPIRDAIVGQTRSGWIRLFLVIVGFSLFSPQTPGPGSFEGFVYTKLPLWVHLLAIPECLLYGFFLSFGLGVWYRRERRWMRNAAIVSIILVVLMSFLAYLDSIGALPKP